MLGVRGDDLVEAGYEVAYDSSLLVILSLSRLREWIWMKDGNGDSLTLFALL